MRALMIAATIFVSGPAGANQSDAATTSSASSPTSQQQAQTAKAEDAADKKICRRVDATESRLNSKKVCLTAEQWKHRDEENSSW